MKNPYAKESILVGKTCLESVLDENGFGAATEMGGFTLDKVPELSLALEPFCTSIFTTSSSARAASKQSVSNIFSFYFPEHKATNTTATPAAISSDPVFCLFGFLVPITTRGGGGG